MFIKVYPVKFNSDLRQYELNESYPHGILINSEKIESITQLTDRVEIELSPSGKCYTVDMLDVDALCEK